MCQYFFFFCSSDQFLWMGGMFIFYFFYEWSFPCIFFTSFMTFWYFRVSLCLCVNHAVVSDLENPEAFQRPLSFIPPLLSKTFPSLHVKGHQFQIPSHTGTIISSLYIFHKNFVFLNFILIVYCIKWWIVN